MRPALAMKPSAMSASILPTREALGGGFATETRTPRAGDDTELAPRSPLVCFQHRLSVRGCPLEAEPGSSKTNRAHYNSLHMPATALGIVRLSREPFHLRLQRDASHAFTKWLYFFKTFLFYQMILIPTCWRLHAAQRPGKEHAPAGQGPYPMLPIAEVPGA